MALGPTRCGVTKALPGEHTVEKEPAYLDDAISSQPSQAVRAIVPGTEAARHGLGRWWLLAITPEPRSHQKERHGH
jgi:hypothetical protein